MGRSQRIFVASALLFAAAIAGCSGGGGAPGGGATPAPAPGTTAPGSTPAPATPDGIATSPPVGVPSPVSTTAGSAQSVTTRPLASGDSFAFGGTLVTSFVFQGSSPRPSATTVATVSQKVVLSGPVTQNGQSNLTDVDTVETDASALATKTTTSDAYERLSSVQGGQTLVEVASQTSTSDGYAIAVTYPAPRVLDVLPETSGATFANSPAQTISESEPGGYSSARTYADDGTYTDMETYPAGTGGGGTSPAATIIEYRQGNGMYSLPLQGSNGDTVITVGSPSPVTTAAPSTISLTLQVPDPTVSPRTATVPVWYAQPLTLYKETNVQTGSKPLPAPCGVPSSIATSANALVRQIERVDTVLGVDDTSTEIVYVAPTFGLVCTQLTDTAKSYYDFSGQSSNGVALADSTTPLETDTVAETVGLTDVVRLNASRRAGASPASGLPADALRAGPARGAFDVAVARARSARVRRAIDGLAKRAGGALR